MRQVMRCRCHMFPLVVLGGLGCLVLLLGAGRVVEHVAPCVRQVVAEPCAADAVLAGGVVQFRAVQTEQTVFGRPCVRYYIGYRFFSSQAGDVPRKLLRRQQVSPADFQRARIGTPVLVRYSPADPHDAKVAAYTPQFWEVLSACPSL